MAKLSHDFFMLLHVQPSALPAPLATCLFLLKEDEDGHQC